MQDRLREIEGTLARTSERKNTILYKLAKRKSQEERLARLGIKKLPTNPRTVADPQVVKYALAQQKQEIGDKIAKLRNPTLVSLERDGEAVVRAKNDDINSLLARKDQWERRLCELEGKEWNPRRYRKKTFFGCAKQLPEAAESSTKLADGKRRRNSGNSSEMGSESASDSGSSDDDTEAREDAGPMENAHDSFTTSTATPRGYADKLVSLGGREMDARLLEEEKQAERNFRESNPLDSNFLAHFRQPLSTSEESYTSQLHELDIPEEAELAKQAVNEKKARLQQKLAALRGSKE